MVRFEKRKSPRAFFVKNFWHSEFHLYSIEVAGKLFTYHHLADYFKCDAEYVSATLQLIEKEYGKSTHPLPHHELNILNPSLAFFKQAIDYYLAYNEKNTIDHLLSRHWPKSQKLFSISECIKIIQHNQPFFFNERLKIKTSLTEFFQWCNLLETESSLSDKIENSNVQLVFDFNQSIVQADDLKKVFDKINNARWKKSLFYLEEPCETSLYECLTKEELSLIALDESLENISTLNTEIFKNAGYYVVKPSLINQDTINALILENKPISLSSAYEHPSLKLGYLPYLSKNLHNDVHGLSTFELFI